MGAHQSANCAIHKHRHSPNSRFHQTVAIENAFLNAFPEKMRKIRRNQQISAPQRFRVVAPRQNTSHHRAIFLVNGFYEAQSRIKDFRFTGILHQMSGAGQVLGNFENCRTYISNSLSYRFHNLFFHKLHIFRVHAAFKR